MGSPVWLGGHRPAALQTWSGHKCATREKIVATVAKGSCEGDCGAKGAV